MRSSTSEMFVWFEWLRELEWRRYEVNCSSFTLLRRGMHRMVRAMLEESESSYEAVRLRGLVLGWLTTPVQFSGITLSAFDFMGTADEVRARWGDEVLSGWRDVMAALPRLAIVENPVRAEVNRIVGEANRNGRHVRILCRRAALESFRTIAQVAALEEQDASCFIHSAADYRDCDPFSDLIRIGPMWSRSFFAVPPAILNAPRYSTLHQIVWSGLSDDADCGVDPLLAAIREPIAGARESESSARPAGITSPRPKSISVTTSDDEPLDSTVEPPEDELGWWREASVTRVPNPNTVVLDLGVAGAISYRPHKQVTVLRESTTTLGIVTEEASALGDGKFYLVLHDVGEFDFGDNHASDGQLSQVWKDRLKDAFTADPRGLMKQLRLAGLDLGTLHNCIRHWIAPSTTVIHAPRERRHFEILVRVLGLEGEHATGVRSGKPSWARQAWFEIAHSRGEAVRFGIEGERIVMEEVRSVLANMLPILREKLRGADALRCEIPPGLSLEGSVVVLRIFTVESGFRVPDAEQERLTTLEELEQWRA